MTGEYVENIKNHVIRAIHLRLNKPISKHSLILLVAMSLGRDTASEDEIDRVIEMMADRMIVGQDSSGRYILNEE